MTDITITVTVNTAQINFRTVNENVTMSDSEDDPSGTDPTEFTTNAKVGDKITWVGVPSSSSPDGDTVSITKIKKESGKDVFGESTIEGSNGEVVGTVQSDTENDEETYKIKFKVTNGEFTSCQFGLDPKIVVEPE